MHYGEAARDPGPLPPVHGLPGLPRCPSQARGPGRARGRPEHRPVLFPFRGTCPAMAGRTHFDGRHALVAEPLLKELTHRLSFMRNVGLEYLSLGRAMATFPAARPSASVWPPSWAPSGGRDLCAGRAFHACTRVTTNACWAPCVPCSSAAIPCWWWSTTRPPSCAADTVPRTGARFRLPGRRDHVPGQRAPTAARRYPHGPLSARRRQHQPARRAA